MHIIMEEYHLLDEEFEISSLENHLLLNHEKTLLELESVYELMSEIRDLRSNAHLTNPELKEYSPAGSATPDTKPLQSVIFQDSSPHEVLSNSHSGKLNKDMMKIKSEVASLKSIITKLIQQLVKNT